MFVRLSDVDLTVKLLVEPPAELVSSIFPWIEEERNALKARRDAVGNAAVDNTLTSFLELLTRLRRIILQDAACLCSKYPGCAFFNYPPFNTPQFSAFTTSAVAAIENAEQEAQHQLSRLPEHVASSFQGAMTSNSMHQEQLRLELQQQYARVAAQLEAMGSLLQAGLLSSASSRKRRKVASAGRSSRSYL
jgi:hypothetical protein